MSFCLESKSSDCKNCYKCIRHCPIKAISFNDNRATIIKDDCILCGRCYLVCPQNVKSVRNDLDLVKKMINNHEKVIVSIAPSFISNYLGCSFSSISKALKKLGFFEVEETAVGATLVKNAYDEMLDEKHDVIISSCCHSINLLIQKHYPKALPYLANVYSPMVAHGKDIKSRYDDAKVVFIGPCIAKKDEGEVYKEYIDAVLTFVELDMWLKEESVEIEKDDSDHNAFSKARLFPICGGILSSMKCENQDYQYLAIDGVEQCERVIKDVIDGKIHKCFIELSACNGSCVNGPMLSSHDQSLAQNYMAIKKNAGDKDFKSFKLKSPEIENNYQAKVILHAEPSEEEIEKTLEKMGKANGANQLNCGSCGYNSCREKAIAVIQGKAIKEMCLPYLMEKAQSFSDKIVSRSPNGLLVLDESLDIQLANKSLCKIIGVDSPEIILKKNVTTIFEPEDFVRALDGESIYSKKTYLNEYDKFVELSITYDHKYHILICILKDITSSEISAQKRAEVLQKTIDITDKVIAKNMRAVQEIASLLGESAAETKVALSSLKDTLKNDK